MSASTTIGLGTLVAACCLIGATSAEAGCSGPREIREATPASIESFVKGRRMKVLTFVGYSGAQYESPAKMLDRAARQLDTHKPARTVVNIGATPDGIGAIYPLAKEMGFTTMGIVSSLARDEKVPLSPCVDYVFYVKDATWGGELEGANRLSPTSAAMVSASTSIVAIGGGDIARAELRAARKAGKPTVFIPADMNHRIARERAAKRGQPAPQDFRGDAHDAFGPK